jgi:hypothetical protein
MFLLGTNNNGIKALITKSFKTHKQRVSLWNEKKVRIKTVYRISLSGVNLYVCQNFRLCTHLIFHLLLVYWIYRPAWSVECCQWLIHIYISHNNTIRIRIRFFVHSVSKFLVHLYSRAFFFNTNEKSQSQVSWNVLC